MMKDWPWTEIVAAALLFAIGILIGQSILAPLSKGWLETYQGLVAGILAVAAAFLTIGKMNATDAAHQRRHDETKDQFLAERNVRIERATKVVEPSLILLHLMAKEAANTTPIGNDFQSAIERSALYLSLADGLDELLTAEALADARHQLDASTEYTIQRLVGLVKAMKRTSEKLGELLVSHSNAMGEIYDGVAQVDEALRRYSLFVAVRLESLMRQLGLEVAADEPED